MIGHVESYFPSDLDLIGNLLQARVGKKCFFDGTIGGGEFKLYKGESLMLICNLSYTFRGTNVSYRLGLGRYYRT